ncbi:MAG: hypothetical protein ACREMN_04785 [Gemmatimonadales bacterium]
MHSALLVALLAAPACQETVLGSGTAPDAPANLTYQLEPSGDPDRPLGILLVWEDVLDGQPAAYRIYSRASTGSAFDLRGETSSNSFHDNGVPSLQYMVTAVDDRGNESSASNVITVDERRQLVQPAWLFSISLNGAVHLQWDDGPYQTAPTRFQWYRIYSSAYNLDTGECDAIWLLEGTTVAPEFLASALANGAPRCFGVTAVSDEGYESLWSPPWQDTPRFDARNTLVFAYDEDTTQSGFRFWRDLNTDGSAEPAELGRVVDGEDPNIDFRMYRDPADSTFWIVPRFAGTSVQVYGSTPVADLTDIDFAPEFGYTRDMIQAVPGYGYVFEIIDGTTLRYGALRMTHVGRDYVIFDWSFQTDLGNPELVVRAGLATSLPTGSQIPDAR